MVPPAAHGEALHITVLGAVSAHRGGQEIRLQRNLRQALAVLVAAGETGLGTEQLADELWPGALPQQWQASVRVAVSRLRKSLGLPLEVRNGRYRLDVHPYQVDAWHLLRLDQTGGWLPEALPYLTAGHCFPGMEPCPAIDQATARLTAARHSLLAKLAASGTPVTAQDLAAFDDEVAAHPGHHQLAAAVERIRAASPLGTGPSTPTIAHDTTTAPPPTGGAGGGAGAGGSVSGDGGPAVGVAGAAPGAVERSRLQIERLRVPHFVGRHQELAALGAALNPERPTVLVVRGPAACGKTSLLAELLHRATGAGHRVVRVAGTSGEPVGLGPFSSALPAFRAALVGDDLDHHGSPGAGGADSLTRKGVLSAHLLDALRAEAAGAHLVVVVDDAHWLDSMSCDLVEFLAYSAGDGHLSLVIGGRPAQTEGRWAQLERALDRMGTTSLTLGPMTEAELVELVGARRPSISLASRAQVARWLHQASQGWPGVAATLLDAEIAPGSDHGPAPAAPAAPGPPPDDPGGGAAEAWTGIYDRLLVPLDDTTRQVGQAAAVLGSPFLLAELAALLQQPEEDLEPALETLTHRDLLTATGPLGQFEFSHQLIADAFARSTLPTRRARLHLRAARLSATVHDLSRHLVEARELADPAETVDAVLTSAREHLADGAFWESITAFRTALSLPSASERDPRPVGQADPDDPGGPQGGVGPLDARALVDYATALGLAGLRPRATQVRGRAHALAVANEQWDVALDAAIAGLPQAEVVDGEPDRVEQISRIPPGRLDPARQLAQAIQGARQAALIGELDAARHWVERAGELACSDEERGAAALTRHFVSSHDTGPADRLATLTAATTGLTLSPRIRCHLALVTAIDHLSLGHLAEAREARAELAALAEEIGDPVRRWHALTLAAQLAETDGCWADADTLAERAVALGRRHGITNADIFRLAQGYFRLRLTGQLAFLAAGISQIPEPDGASLLFASAKATMLEAAGQHDDARAQTLAIAGQLVEHPSASAVGCLGIIAPLVGRYGGPTLVAAVRRMLDPFQGTALIVGAGLGNLGPVDALLASLDRPTGPAREKALRQAVRQADRLGHRSWQVRLRVDLAAADGADQPLDEARALAQGTDLAPLVDQDPGWPPSC